MNLLFCAFGGYFLTLLIKTTFPWKLRARSKLFWVIVGAFGTAGLVDHHSPYRVALLGLGGAGLAVLVHRASRVLLLLGDRMMALNVRDFRDHQRR